MSLSTKLSISFALVVITVASILLFGFQQIASNWLRDGLRDRIGDAVAIAATQLDSSAFAQLNRVEQESSANYLSLRTQLQSIRDAGNGYRFVYTVRQLPDGRIAFVVDAEENPADRSALGEIYDDPGPVLEANAGLLSEPMVEDEFYTDKWGTWLTGYAPVLGPDGQQGAILAMDVAASAVLAHERQALLVAITGFVVMVFFAVLLGRLLGRRLAAPIVALTRSVERISVGEFDQLVDIRSSDETRDLGLAFNTMTQDLGASLDALRQNEEELRRHQNKLEQLVRERTRKLTAGVQRLRQEVKAREAHERDLIKAKAEAEAANRAKSDFLANMSHEIRTPLNGVIGMTDILMTSELSSEQRENLGIVQRSANALLVILNDILDLSKVEANKLILENTEFSLRDTLADSVQGLATRAKEKKLRLACRVAPNVPDLLDGDQVRLRQIVVNLVGNGIKFSDVGDVAVNVSLVTQSHDNVRLGFEISDTGIGIAVENQQDVFNAFSQADQTTARRYGGTGLGLAICKRLVALMGGELALDSAEGRGSTFRFELEFATQGDGPMHRLLCSLQGMRVLAVGDDSGDLDTVTDVLSNWGLAPLAVDSAAGALDALREGAAQGRPYPLVLNDVALDGQDSCALVTALRAEPLLAQTRMILLASAGSLTAMESSARQLSAVLCCLKPFRRTALLDAIAQAINAELPQPEPRCPAPSAERSMRILLVDDVKVNQTVTGCFLESLGHQSVVASDGNEALARWQEQTFDVILMDVQMPGMDGLMATEEIRRREQGMVRTPIIAMTARVMKGDKEICLAAGMDDYLAKPFALKELAECLARVLS